MVFLRSRFSKVFFFSVEAVTDPALIPRVFINDLVKVYNKKQVKPSVNHLNLTLYESQITALLGHNGKLS